MASARYRGRMIVNDTDYTGSFVDPNPEGVATDDLNTVAIDGHIFNVVGSGGGGVGDITNYYGVFIDTQNVILPETRYTNGESYTATQDCYGFICYQLGSGKTQITLDGMDLVNISGVSNIYSYIVVNLAKGQTINFISTFSGSFYLTVYGVKSGSEASYFQPIIYSTEEREVGVWTDNKPLYQKTIVFGSITNRSSISIGVANVEHISLVPDGSWVNDGERPLPYVIGSDASNNIGGYFTIGTSDTSFEVRMGNGSASDSRNGAITVQYTKTTDVAGSGSYTTLGVPAHHYDSNEKIIGTWFGETLYEKTMEIVNSTKGSVTIDLTGMNISRIVKKEGIWDRTNNQDTYWMDFGVYINSEIYSYLSDDIGHNRLYMARFARSNETLTKAYITIQYTKTSN